MIDLGGQGTILALTNTTKNFKLLQKVSIPTAHGTEYCDEVSSNIMISLAGMNFGQREFYRCADFDASISPMFGADYFRGHLFAMYFSRQTFSWLNRPISVPRLALRYNGLWFLVPSQIGNVVTSAVIDTGAPTTLVDQTFFNSHRDLFGVLDAQTQTARLNQPLVIGNVSFSGTSVLIMDLKTSFGTAAPDIFVGMNHIVEADWELDYSGSQLYVRKN